MWLPDKRIGRITEQIRWMIPFYIKRSPDKLLYRFIRRAVQDVPLDTWILFSEVFKQTSHSKVRLARTILTYYRPVLPQMDIQIIAWSGEITRFIPYAH